MTDTHISRVQVTFLKWTKYTMHRRAVRARRRDRRKRGRKKGKGLGFLTRRHAHAERGMQMCTKRREHFAARCSCAYPALSSPSPHRLLFLAHHASSGIPRAFSRPRTRRISHKHTHTQPRAPEEDTVATPSTVFPRFPTTSNDRSVGRSFGRSQGIISLEAPGSEESRVYGV